MIKRRQRLTGARRTARRLCALACACATALGAAAILTHAQAGARIVAAQLGGGNTPDYRIVNPATTFAPDAPQVVCVWRVVNVPASGATLRSVWVAVDTGGVVSPNYEIAGRAYPLTQAGTATGVFSLSRPDNGWPAGRYRLDLYLDDRLAQSLPFSIYTAAAAAAYARIEPLVAEADKLSAAGDYRAAANALREALALAEQQLGAEHPDTAALLNNLALALKESGAYDESERLYRRGLALAEKLEGPASPPYALLLTNLGELYNLKGDYAQAEQTLKRAAAVAEQAVGPAHRLTATALNNLARTYQLKGDYREAEALYRRALPLLEQTAGAESEDVATLVNNLAELYREQDDFARAEPLYLRALAIKAKLLPPDHPDTALTRNNLALLYTARGDYAQAEPLFKSALAAEEKALGPNHPDVGGMLNNLALLYQERGDNKQARPLYERALAVFEHALGPHHANVAQALVSLARLSAATGDLKTAGAQLTRAADVREQNIALVLTTGSEQQKQLYLDTLFGETNLTVSFHLQAAPTDEAAARLALTTLLRRKGRALDAMSDQIGRLRRRLDPADARLLDELAATRARLAALLLQSAGAQTDDAARGTEVARLEAEAQRLETEVSARSAEFRAQAQPVTLAAVQAAVPADAALVELARYYPFDFKAGHARGGFGPARYAAYVVRRDGAPAWVELGAAAPIERGVAELRAALARPNSKNVSELARALDAQVMQPVRKALGDTRRLFLSPEGALNLIPFGALVDEQGKHLVESYTITYLTSGRDLLRLQTSAPAGQGVTIIANPAFDNAAGNAPAAGARRSADLRNARFTPLPGTAGEAQAITAVLPAARVLTQAQATEAALKQVNAPAVLHVATHGFFLADQPQDPGSAARGLALGGGDGATTARTAPRAENPLLRSGLALAGANRREGAGGEDGILTALEAAGLNLWGTELVVLSACETGLGEINAMNSEGVYGLRRALVLAGAESQVMSLWQVDDAATRDLMSAYYRRLQAGEGRTDALRQVQLEMLKGQAQTEAGDQRGLGGQPTPRATGAAADRSHPFYWASFIQSGAWQSLR
ncbi:MAG TPA: CHAT domain-containing tetratricopeptide repeat protein [Pyrinomonadaceae bacterium]